MNMDLQSHSGRYDSQVARRFVAVSRVLLTTLVGCLSLTGHASDVSGFASLGGGLLDKEDLTFVDYNDRVSFDTDTIIGVQLQSELSEYWRLTTQAVSRGYRSDNHGDYTPELEWLFLTYQWSTDLRLRAGKLRTPFFLHSEDLEVGYAYPWVRPPIDVYALIVTPFSNYEGVDATFFNQLFGAELETQVYLGTHDEKYMGIDISGNVIYGLASQVREGDWIGRFSFLNALADYSDERINQLRSGMDQVAQFVPAFTGVSDQFTVDHQWIQYYSVGAEWDPGRWTLTSEVSYIAGPSKGLTSNTFAGYVSIARQLGDWQPYVVLSRLNNRLKDRVANSITNTYQSIAPGVNAELDALRNGALQIVASTRMIENVYTLGARFDLMPKLALKAQVDHFSFGQNSIGQFQSRGQGPYSDHAHLFSFTLDSVF